MLLINQFRNEIFEFTKEEKFKAEDFAMCKADIKSSWTDAKSPKYDPNDFLLTVWSSELEKSSEYFSENGMREDQSLQLKYLNAIEKKTSYLQKTQALQALFGTLSWVWLKKGT